jgi:rhamnulokinase
MPNRAGNGHTDRTYCAIDLGAESGRVVLVRLRGGVLTAEDVSRFPNEPVRYAGALHWDIVRLWWNICHALAGIQESRLDGIGVDTWGVDYALLGEHGELLQNPYHYRDVRTNGVMERVLERVSKEEIYNSTGIQFMPINTLYQLVAAKRDTPKLLTSAERLATIPDLFHYWLSGTPVCEFTNATTTQLVNPVTRTWACDLIERLELPAQLFAKISEPGTILGPMLPEVSQGHCSAPVILPGSHDTASAVAGVSARDGTAFLSSGTWSLIGTEVDSPVINKDSLRLNFTNEGGVNGTTRLLKNVMGLWILQACRKCWSAAGKNYSYQDLMDLAAEAAPFQVLIDPDDESFLAPADMSGAIDAFCRRTEQASPSSAGEYVRAIFESLALKYRVVVQSLEQLVGNRIEQIRVIGGGSKNRLLNQFTADATGKRVMAGPVEATALGNVAVQILATGGADSLKQVRGIIDQSFPAEIFEPREPGAWDRQAERFRHYCEFDLCLK